MESMRAENRCLDIVRNPWFERLTMTAIFLNAAPLRNPKMTYLEGQGDLVTGLLMGIIEVTIWVIGVTNLLTKSP